MNSFTKQSCHLWGLGAMLLFSSAGYDMKHEDRIIGSAVYDILQAGVVDHISKKMLIQHLTRKYVYIYETSSTVEESLHYESAIKILSKSPD